MTNSKSIHKRYKQQQKQQSQCYTQQKVKCTVTKNAKVPFFTRRLRAEVQRVWSRQQHESKHGLQQQQQQQQKQRTVMKVVPVFKVGTLEMYKRFPDAYDALMQRHDCSAINQYLHDVILTRLLSLRRRKRLVQTPHSSQWCQKQQLQSSIQTPTLSVMDVGCGTGRIASMLAQSPHVIHIYAYDNALPMLQRCVVNVVKSVATSLSSSSSQLVLSTNQSLSAFKVKSEQDVNEKEVDVNQLDCSHQSCALHIQYMPAAHQFSEQVNQAASDVTSSKQQDDPTSLTAKTSANPFHSTTTTTIAAPTNKSQKLQLCSTKSKGSTTKTLHLQLCSYHDIKQGYFTRRAHPPVSLIVCTWSLSYVMRQNWNDTSKWQEAIKQIITQLLALLQTSQTPTPPKQQSQQQQQHHMNEPRQKAKTCHNVQCTSALVIIETLGTNSVGPTRQNVMMQWLVKQFGFQLKWVQTDYHFHSAAEAVRLTNFFFGNSMSQLMAKQQVSSQSSETQQSPVLHECTGIWTL